MMLRSSSTPVLGSLLASFSESPNNISNHHYEAKPNTNLRHSHNKLSVYQPAHLSHTTFSANSSPISPSVDFDRFSHKGFRRAQSDGNLAGLAFDASTCNNSVDQSLCDSISHTSNNMFTRRPKCLMLETIPSFSWLNSKGNFEEEDDEEVEEEIDMDDYGEGNDGVGNPSLGFEDRLKNQSVTQEVRFKDEIWKVGFGHENGQVAQGLYIAEGLEVGSGDGGRSGGGRGGEFHSFGGGGDGEDKPGFEEYYRRMVEENPGNSLFLGNYAQFLYQSKGDLERAEEYYSRAILADPRDGGVLSQYANLVWELHHDQDRASSFFERAVEASPQDSYVQAAYAHFLWETEDETDNVEDLHTLQQTVHDGLSASATSVE